MANDIIQVEYDSLQRIAKQFEKSSSRTRQGSLRLRRQVGSLKHGAGHDAPTDHPGRQLLLEVRAQDGAGRPLTLLAGPPRLPEWSGELAGQPGEAYAKVLADVTTGAAPVVSYWKPTRLVSDNRIAAHETAWTAYTFLLPPGATQVQVTAELNYASAAFSRKQPWPKAGTRPIS